LQGVFCGFTATAQAWGVRTAKAGKKASIITNLQATIDDWFVGIIATINHDSIKGRALGYANSATN